jgi:hypothetical protein
MISQFNLGFFSWKKGKLKCEMIWTIWKKGKTNSEKKMENTEENCEKI